MADKEVVENEYLKLFIEDGMVKVFYKPDSVISLSAAQYMVKERLRICHDKTYPLFADIRGLKYMSKEARDFIKQGDGVKGVSSFAALLNNSVQATLGNYFLKFSPPLLPSRLFTDEEKALQWLAKFK